MDTMLVTGASGFIGSFICQEGIARGYEVWAGIRWSSSKQYLKDKALHLITLDLSSPETLRGQLKEAKRMLGGHGWDYVVHAAGATKSRNEQGFMRTNYEGTRNLAEALLAEDMCPRRFLFMSSLSVYGPCREKQDSTDPCRRYSPILGSDTPRPNTAYGRSKLRAEEYLLSMSTEGRLPLTILRPTGVYGPRERDYYLMAKSVKNHVDVGAGWRRQEITFVNVHDLVTAVFQAMVSEHTVGKAYFISDGQVYSSKTFSLLLQQEMGVRHVLHVKLPLCFLWLACAVAGLFGQWLHHPTALNLDKFHILSQRNWQCDVTPARQDFDYSPSVSLAQGVKEAVAWYKCEGWL